MKSVFYRIAGALLALVLALLLPLGVWATAYHTISIDGTNDFDTSTEQFSTTSGTTLYAYTTWDADSLYFGFSGSTPAGPVSDGNRVYHIYLDTDPQATPTSGNGTTDGETWRWDPTLPFNADYHYAFKTEDNSEYKRSYSGGAWGDATFTTSNWKATGFWELSIARADLGNPAAVYAALYVEEDWDGGSISGGAPDSLFTNTDTQGAIAFNAHWLGFVLDPGIASNHADNVGCNPAITVTSADDDGADNLLDDSLRKAIADACVGGSIAFSGDTSITLSSDVLAINKRLTIDGGSHAVTVSGNHAVHVFDIGTSGVVTLSHLSIVSGTTTSSGGGINNKGALTVQDCVLSDNVSGDNGGGIFNDAGGQMTVQNSVLSDNQVSPGGGGIGNRGTLTLRDSTLSGNSASYGGGIYNADGGQMTVYNSTLSGNAATGSDYGGGAIDQWVSGDDSVSGTIINSTIVNNTAVNAHTSGIWLESGPLTLHNSIVAHNNGTNNFVQEAGTTFVSQGYNLANAWNGLTTHETDLTADPLLGPLGDYGGGTGGAVTAPPRANSPAIDAGDPASCPATDQRGAPRDDLRCDIGAYERQFDDAGGDTVVKTGFTGGTAYSFGPTWVSMTLAAADTGSITVTKHLTTPGGEWDTGEITVTWWITTNLSASPAITVSFCYTTTEIGDAQEEGLTPFRWNGSNWEAFAGSYEVDTENHCVTARGVSEFSPWTLFDTSGMAEKPTAARVVGLATRGVVPFLAGLLALGGAAALRRRRR